MYTYVSTVLLIRLTELLLYENMKAFSIFNDSSENFLKETVSVDYSDMYGGPKLQRLGPGLK